MSLTAAHWLYAAFVAVVIVTMAKRRDPILPCIAGTFTLGWLVLGTPLDGIQTVFRSSVVAARELLDIVLVVSMIVALAGGLERVGAERLMIAPARKLMRSPESAFWIIGAVMLIVSYFLWPTPASALVGAVLAPAAVAAGLPAISTAVAMNIFGHGIALSTDYVIQGAPSISAKAANVSVVAVMQGGIPLIITMSIVTVGVSFIMARREIARAAGRESKAQEPTAEGITMSAAVPAGHNPVIMPVEQADAAAASAELSRPSTIARAAAVIVPLSFVAVVVALAAFDIRGGEATAIIGGLALLLLSGLNLIGHGIKGLDLITEDLVKGFSFGIRIFTPVIMIASFFYLGSPELARKVFGDGARGLLFDLARALSNLVPLNRITVGVLETTIGSIVGLVGSGFSGLPLTGSLAGAFGAVASLRTETIAALGQIASVWVGGGCIIPWSLVSVAAICRVSPQELARRNFIPVLLGLVVTTAVAVVVI